METVCKTGARKRKVSAQDVKIEKDVSIHKIPSRGNDVVHDSSFTDETVSFNDTRVIEETSIVDLTTGSNMSNINVDNSTNRKEMVGNACTIGSETTLAPCSTGIKSKQTTNECSGKLADCVKETMLRKMKVKPWKKRTIFRLRGEEYISSTGKKVPKKVVQACDCSKCRYRCSEKLSYEQRCAIRNFYYGLDSYEKQKDFICSNIEEENSRTFFKERTEGQKKKLVTRVFYFEVGNKRVRVCKKFFLKTLCISEVVITLAMSKKVCGHFRGTDGRGKHNTTPERATEEQLAGIQNHIESSPTSKSADLNIKTMYEAYVMYCENKNCEPVTEAVYKCVLNEKYNITVHDKIKGKAPDRATEEQLAGIRNHIESFPVTESHLTQHSSNRKYLAEDLKSMYEAYVIYCKRKNIRPMTEAIYRRAFKEEYNISYDNKIKRKAYIRIPEGQLAGVKKHIESFPTLESHYARRSRKRYYLAADLNMKRMYDAYVTYCKNRNNRPVTETIYRRVFKEKYNLAFHQPNHEKCSVCANFFSDRRRRTMEESLKEKYQMHRKRKVVAKKHKCNDSKTATENKSVHTCSIFFQPTLYTPCSQESNNLYMRKFYCHNLSIHSTSDKKATCFLWSETDGKHGSNEISTCLNLYVSKLDPSVKHVILYSDFITGKKRNQIIAKCLQYSLTTIQNIQVIDYKVYERGHSYIEHHMLNSAVEFAKLTTKIVVPCQWETVIFMARKGSPYSVVMLEHKDFKDFKGMKFEITDENESEYKAEWGNMKWMRFKKKTPNICYYKYDLEETDFKTLKMVGEKKAEMQPQQLYLTKLPISIAQKDDLLLMCKSGVIPTEFYNYYKNLPASTSVLERLPEPDRRELEVDTDIEEEELEVDTDITEESDMNMDVDDNKLSKDETSIKEEESDLDTDFEEEELEVDTDITEESDMNTDIDENEEDTSEMNRYMYIKEKESDWETDCEEELDMDTYIEIEQSELDTDINEYESDVDTDQY